MPLKINVDFQRQKFFPQELHLLIFLTNFALLHFTYICNSPLKEDGYLKSLIS